MGGAKLLIEHTAYNLGITETNIVQLLMYVTGLAMEEFSYFQSYCLHEQPSFVQCIYIYTR